MVGSWLYWEIPAVDEMSHAPNSCRPVSLSKSIESNGSPDEAVGTGLRLWVSESAGFEMTGPERVSYMDFDVSCWCLIQLCRQPRIVSCW